MKKKININKLKVQGENLKRINLNLRKEDINVRSQIDNIKNQPARTLTPESLARIKSRVRELMDLLDINNIGETALMYKERELEHITSMIKDNESSLNEINKILKKNEK